jgi:hypothetical protein
MVITDDGIMVVERHYYKKRDQNEISKSLKGFCIKTMLCSSLPPLVCRRVHVLFMLSFRIVMSNFVSYDMSLRSLFSVAMSVTISHKYDVLSVFPPVVCTGRLSYICYSCLPAHRGVKHVLNI